MFALAVGYLLLADVRGLISFYVSALGVLALLSVAALLRFRRTGAGAADAFRAPGGVWLPAAWGIGTLLVLAAALADASARIGVSGALVVLLVLAAAFPAHAWWAARKERPL